MCKNAGVCGFLCTSWVLITYNICPPVINGTFLNLFAFFAPQAQHSTAQHNAVNP